MTAYRCSGPTLAAMMILAVSSLTAQAQDGKKNAAATTADKAAITALLSRYQDALNASSTEASMPLYTEDGVFMPPY